MFPLGLGKKYFKRNILRFFISIEKKITVTINGVIIFGTNYISLLFSCDIMKSNNSNYIYNYFITNFTILILIYTKINYKNDFPDYNVLSS